MVSQKRSPDDILSSIRKRVLADYSEERLETLGLCHPGQLDVALVRYLVARNHDEEAAFTMLRNSIAWRIEMDMPTLMSNLALPADKLDIIRRYNPQGFHKTDKMGHHIYIERTGFMDVPKILRVCTEADVVRAHTQKVEYHFHALATQELPKLVIIYDLSGIGMHTFRSEVFAAIKTITSLNQDHYPETLQKVYIVHAPFFFNAIYRLIQTFLPVTVRDKIKFCHVDHLLEVVDPANLPAFLGGTCSCVPGETHGGCISSDTFSHTPFFKQLDAHVTSKTQPMPT